MTVLPHAAALPSSGDGTGTFVTLQCDVCRPPVVTTTSLRALHTNGWATTLAGADLEICAPCCRRLRSSQWVRAAPSPDRDEGTLPNLVVIGAAKCATTSLHAFLDAHPEVHMAPAKEPNFFQDPDGQEWLGLYKRQFDPGAKVNGESSTSYTRYPFVPDVPERMGKVIPDARLIYMVRDPVERAVSHYVEERSHGNEPRLIEEAFADLRSERNPYIAASRYAMQLSRFLEVYPREHVMVLDTHDLGAALTETMRSVYGFLGLPVTEVDLRGPVRRNTREEKREYSRPARLVRDSGLLKLAYRLPAHRREQVLEPLRVLLSRPIERPELPPSLRERVADSLADDAAELRTLTGQPFDDWSV